MTKNKAAAPTDNFGFSEIEKKINKKSLIVFRAINHPLRQQIIELLEENEKMTVTDLYIKLRLEQSVASQHLAILRRAGVVATERQGKFIYYCVDQQRKATISRLSEELSEGL